MQLQHDISFTIATAPQRFAKKWKHTETTWSHLLERLSKPTVSGETVAEYKSMRKADRDNRKDIGGFVCGRLRDGRRLKQNVEYRQVISLDADSPSSDFLTDLDLGIGLVAWGLYSTHSHTARAPRYRILIPLSRAVSADEYQAIARMLAKDIDIDAMDVTTYEPERLMYWPSHAQDGEFVFRYNDAPIVNADAVLGRYDDWKDTSLWPTSKKEAAVTLSTVKKQGDPLTKSGIIGAFCRAHTIEDAIASFLSDVYEPCATEGRYTYKNGSTGAGLVVYDGKFAYSHHSTDPVGGKLCNAFDLVRLHLFGTEDDSVAEGTPVGKLPSYMKMREFANNDKATKRVLGAEQAEELKKSFAKHAGLIVEDVDWVEQLSRSSGKNASVLPVAANFILILENDPLLKGTFGLDVFSQRLFVRKDLPWRKLGDDRIWRDSDDAGLRNYLSCYYDLTGRAVIDDALVEVMHRHSSHPVRDYLKSLDPWDGVKRAENLFIEFLGAEDSQYVKDVTRTWLKAAVARVTSPGVKYDACLVLSGPQGIGKSTILGKLGGKWFNDSIVGFQGKEAMEQLQGSWIIELSEMQATTKADNDMIKAFLSRQTDKFRAPYGRRTEEYPRQCVFAATTNDSIFLKDRTGGRRFLPIFCRGEGVRELPELTEEFIDQVWAEVLELYEADRSLFLPAESAKVARELQEAHTEGTEKLGLVLDYLDTKLPENWENLDLYERRDYLRNHGEVGYPEGTVVRDRVCALEIWCEVFDGTRQNFRNIDARQINGILQQLKDWEVYKDNRILRFGKLYGRQRAFMRKE